MKKLIAIVLTLAIIVATIATTVYAIINANTTGLVPINNLYAQNFTALYTNKNEVHIQDQLGYEYVLNNVEPIDDGSEIIVIFDDNGTIPLEDDIIVSWNYSEYND